MKLKTFFMNLEIFLLYNTFHSYIFAPGKTQRFIFCMCTVQNIKADQQFTFLRQGSYGRQSIN